MLYNLHSIGQVSADVWFEMYNGVHRQEGTYRQSMMRPDYFSLQVEDIGTTWRNNGDEDHYRPRHYVSNGVLGGTSLLPDVNYTHRDDFD